MATMSSPYTGPERRLPGATLRYAGDERRAATGAHQGGMDSRIKFLGHPVHQQLVALPIGLLAGSVVFDLIHLANDSGSIAHVAFWMLVSGLAVALLAAPFGYIDWLAIPQNTRAKRVGMLHGIGNLAVVMLFGLSALMRINDLQTPPPLAIGFSVAAVLLAVVTAWLGGELVSRLGVGVSAELGLDASNSIAAEHRRKR